MGLRGPRTASEPKKSLVPPPVGTVPSGRGPACLPVPSSMVIRDLTLRSAASFGSFHLIRLLYDEYMFYLVEHRVAEATGETPIAVMGEVSARPGARGARARLGLQDGVCRAGCGVQAKARHPEHSGL